MRRLVLVGFLVAGIAVPAASTAAPGVQRPPYDWALMVLTAGPHGASNVRYVHEAKARGPVSRNVTLSGWGVVESVYDPANQKTPFLSCAVVRTFQGKFAETNVRVTATGPIARLDPGERFADLYFFPNARITLSRMSAVPRTGSVTVQRAYGTGSRALAFGSGAAGSANSESLAVGTGLAGGFDQPLVQPLTAGVASWTAPDKSTGSFLVGPPSSACGNRSPWTPAFAGGSGRWTWAWQGVDQNQVGRGVVAWAPIGRYWPLFRGTPADDTVIGPSGASIVASRGSASAWPTS